MLCYGIVQTDSVTFADCASWQAPEHRTGYPVEHARSAAQRRSDDLTAGGGGGRGPLDIRGTAAIVEPTGLGSHPVGPAIPK